MLTFKTVITACFAILLSAGSTRATAQVETNKFHSGWRESAEGPWNCKVDRQCMSELL